LDVVDAFVVVVVVVVGFFVKMCGISGRFSILVSEMFLGFGKRAKRPLPVLALSFFSSFLSPASGTSSSSSSPKSRKDGMEICTLPPFFLDEEIFEETPEESFKDWFFSASLISQSRGRRKSSNSSSTAEAEAESAFGVGRIDPKLREDEEEVKSKGGGGDEEEVVDEASVADALRGLGSRREEPDSPTISPSIPAPCPDVVGCRVEEEEFPTTR